MDQNKDNVKQTPPEVQKEVRPVETVTEEKKKMSTGAKVAIGCGVILLLGLIALGALALAGVSLFSRVAEDFDNVIEEEFTDSLENLEESEILNEGPSDEDEEFLYKKSTEEGLDGDLESDDILTDAFPNDLPLSGGKLTASSQDERRIIAELDVNSTVQDTKEWYVQTLKDEGWEITSQSETEPVEGWTSIDVSFESADGERRGDLKIEQTPYTQIPHVRIREILY